jgi:hypothetical protein
VCSVRGDYFLQVISPEPKDPKPGEPIFTSRPLKQKNRSLFAESKLLQFEGIPGQEETTLLAWRLNSSSANELPLDVRFWIPDPSGTSVTVSCEVELKHDKLAFSSITVSIPVQNPSSATVSQCNGETKAYEGPEGGLLVWTIEGLNRDRRMAELEFSIAAKTEEEFYPISVEFLGEALFCNVDVANVMLGENGGDEVPDLDSVVKFDVVKAYTAKAFSISK